MLSGHGALPIRNHDVHPPSLSFGTRPDIWPRQPWVVPVLHAVAFGAACPPESRWGSLAVLPAEHRKGNSSSDRFRIVYKPIRPGGGLFSVRNRASSRMLSAQPTEPQRDTSRTKELDVHARLGFSCLDLLLGGLFRCAKWSARNRGSGHPGLTWHKHRDGWLIDGCGDVEVKQQPVPSQIIIILRAPSQLPQLTQLHFALYYTAVQTNSATVAYSGPIILNVQSSFLRM